MEKEKPFPVFVDNIDEAVQTKDLRKIFTRCGLVKEVTIISHYGFVNFRSPDDAVKSIEQLNNSMFFGKKLKVEASEELDNFLKQREQTLELQHQQRRKLGLNFNINNVENLWIIIISIVNKVITIISTTITIGLRRIIIILLKNNDQDHDPKRKECQ